MSRNPVRLAALGEVMVELAPTRQPASQGGTYNLGFAGDTFNTAVSLARLGIDVAYATRLGDDTFSHRIIELLRQEGISTQLIEQVPGRQPGLYVINNTADGERSFRYWRKESPARELFESASAGPLALALSNCSHIYLSGITLAIMADQARDRLYTFAKQFRDNGGTLVFDSNYRPALWPNLEKAQSVIDHFLALADIALLTLEDEQALWGISSADELSAHHQRYDLAELVIKQGGKPVLLAQGNQLTSVPVEPVEDIVDTTGAGDAFNAGYLAARLQGSTGEQAVKLGNRAAAAVIRRHGGLVERDYFQSTVVDASD